MLGSRPMGLGHRYGCNREREVERKRERELESKGKKTINGNDGPNSFVIN
jgi:hypothetical protein